ncbi:hypothetical protein Ciccas_008394 [Cichlidogyrus casuarinus]|uniref:Uncharacterized protein n=1 Tax=Cichlidogyrus casuarinus TaxID=1844966 RepID=A0ABD2Q037_9PLAT
MEYEEQKAAVRNADYNNMHKLQKFVFLFFYTWVGDPCNARREPSDKEKLQNVEKQPPVKTGVNNPGFVIQEENNIIRSSQYTGLDPPPASKNTATVSTTGEMARNNSSDHLLTTGTEEAIDALLGPKISRLIMEYEEQKAAVRNADYNNMNKLQKFVLLFFYTWVGDPCNVRREPSDKEKLHNAEKQPPAKTGDTNTAVVIQEANNIYRKSQLTGLEPPRTSTNILAGYEVPLEKCQQEITHPTIS